MFITGVLCLAVSLLMWVIKEMYSKIEKMEKILKSMNDDLNMVSRTMDNMHKEQKEKKQILKG
jgi:hypothetical protein